MRKVFFYLLLCAIGTGIMLLIRFASGHTTIQEGEYYYSDTLRYGYNAMTACLFFLIGVAVGLYTRLNPWLTGLCVVIMLPAVSFYEAAVYTGSHNLIPIELFIHFVFALPAIVGVFVGRLIYNKRVMKLRGEGRR
jgi:hypothetical protein